MSTIESESKIPVSESHLLYRQVHPAWVQDTRVSSQAFKPSKKDEDKLSVSDGTKTSPLDSYNRFVNLKFKSSGVWAVSTLEVENAGLSAFSEPVTTPEPDPAHAYIDFTDLTNSQQQKAADKLAASARARGCVFRRPDSEQQQN
jgi:hypothetical protein